MSIMGYLVPGRNEMNVAKVEINKDIRVTGPILEGRSTLEQALLEAGRMPQRTYPRVAEYDAVLRAHCGL